MSYEEATGVKSLVAFFSFKYISLDMISVQKLWDRLNALTKSGTSGYFTQEEFNSNLYSVQYTILSLLCDNYENNQKVSDALINHTVETNLSTVAGGKLFTTSVISQFTTYYRTLALQYTISGGQYPSKKIAVNEIGMYMSSPIRKDNIAKNRTLYYLIGNNIQVLPKTTGLPFIFIYCKKPNDAKIAFTTATDADNDYLVIDTVNTTDIDFPEGLFNLFVYFMLESMGIEQRENLMQSYSELGINRTVQTDIK